ncbi:MAG: ribonuclease J [Chloroflexi bacterium]|nr:ribonuclease J [Chloroflexota bacterium]
MSDLLRVIPLGGLGEIGKNMMAIEYDNQMVVIDAGLMFPEYDMPGIDLVIPDYQYVVERKDKLKAILLTHGHEDHIGSLPYFLREVDAPIYSTRLTRGLVEVKLKDHKRLDGTQLVTINPGEPFTLGPFNIEAFRVCHSIPDGVGYAIETPQGILVHSGDFKFDNQPVDGNLTDFGRLAGYGDRNVLMLMSDSTNAEHEGKTPSEAIIAGTFDQVFEVARGRIIVSTFASNISRIQQVVNAAVKHGRKVGVLGRSMVENVKMAQALGYLKAPEGTLVSLDTLETLPRHEVAIVCTGSQGEPTSVLVRMANRDHRQFAVEAGDTVILSATPIPGNEELVHRTINNLFRLGADVLYHQLLDVHVSGHGYKDDQRMMINLLKPKHFMPIHGEYRHLVLHGRLAEDLDVDQVFVVENGHVLEFEHGKGQQRGRIPGGYVFVDGVSIGEIDEVVLRDRHHLANDGFVVVVLAIDKQSGELAQEPDILTRGFIYSRDAGDLIEEAKQRIVKLSHAGMRVENAQNRIKEVVGQFFYERTKRRPMVLPLVIEV